MATVDHKGEVLAHYRAIRIEAEAGNAAHLALYMREPIEKATRRLKAMVLDYLEGYPKRMGKVRW